MRTPCCWARPSASDVNRSLRWWPLALLFVALLLAHHTTGGASAAEEEEGDPAEVAVGERLFLETRFAEYFASHMTSVNAPLAVGDPTVATTETLAGPIANPFAGQSMNCRVCHFVDDQKTTAGGGSRSYDDFTRRSAIPARADGETHTPRNSPTLVGASLDRSRPFLLHFDGEFPSAAALVRGTFTGRNFGWLPGEAARAVAHIARVIREDDGAGDLAQSAGGAYRDVLSAAPSVPKDFRLPPRFRVDVAQASDEQIMNAVAALVAAYVESLEFAADETGANAGSPYDLFLKTNGAPRKVMNGETPADYLRRLRASLAEVPSPTFVTPAAGTFALHQQPFQFGATELEGMKIFLSPTRGNCVACHVPPTFTDFGLHDTGVSQRDYDQAHGAGAFVALAIPDESARSASPDAFLPASGGHPQAREPFRRLVDAGHAGYADLGVWNIFRNPDVVNRKQQRGIERLVCRAREIPLRSCSKRVTLDDAIGLFKTPTLRDLGHSAPYFHSGSIDTIEDAIRFYVDSSAQAKSGALRNGAPELARMNLTAGDVVPLAAFLRALNEDYE